MYGSSRLITAGFLKEHSEEYAPFIEDCSLADYCTTEIESMWKDADHLAVTGLVNAIGKLQTAVTSVCTLEKVRYASSARAIESREWKQAVRLQCWI